MAATLNNLANLYSDTQRMEPAEQAYDEALKTYRGLAKDNPAAYLPNVAATLFNGSMLFYNGDRATEGERSLQEATSLYRDLYGRTVQLSATI